jgi:hypothetical protein
MLKSRGIELIAADKPDAFLDDTPTATIAFKPGGQQQQIATPAL